MIKKIKIQRFFIILILILLGTLTIIVSEMHTKKNNLLVKTTVPYITTIKQKQMISGNLYPIKEIEVKSIIPGILETYYVHAGDRIKKGDKIAKIKTLTEPSQIENAKTNLKTSAIVFEKDLLNYERDRKLFDKGVISRSEFEDISKSYKISKEQYEYAKNQLHLLEEGYIPSSNISNVVIATADGILIDLPLEEGTPVIERNNFRDGTTIALIAQLDSFLFKGKIVEKDVLALRNGGKLTILPSSIEGFQTEATIRKITPKGYLDQGIMKYDIDAVFKLPENIRIFSGFNATAEFILKEKENVLVIPESCLIFRNDSIFVEVLTNGEFEEKPIKIGLSNGIEVEILEGIEEHSKIKNKP